MKSAMILISDRTDSLAVQIIEDQDADRNNENNGSLYEFIESATYSNEETTVISYISLFERLWQQVELKR